MHKNHPAFLGNNINAFRMNKKCPNCDLVNLGGSKTCLRCRTALIETENITSNRNFLKSPLVNRTLVFLFAFAFTLSGFYISLVLSAAPLEANEGAEVQRAIGILKVKGFNDEVFLLENLTSFRSNDNWLNMSVKKENAYAATNFPFEIMTLYPEFFERSTDDVERAAILLHEAKHLEGKGESAAYEFVWLNRKRLGWTRQRYGNSEVWLNVRSQTKENAPNLFLCGEKEVGDCTE
jgi:hypothetical protein